MKTVGYVSAVVLVYLANIAAGQNFTSGGSGAWTTGSNWSGGTSPSLTNEGWGTVNVNHNMTITGNYSVPNSTVNIAAGKTLTITGNLSVAVGAGGGNTINVYGTLQVNGNVTISSNLIIHPGGKVVVDGSMTVISSQYLTVGTAVAPPPYADLVIKQNLVSQQSGDVTVRQNGRMAVYGNVTNNTSGGSLLNINAGGQVYIHGNINLTAGGNTITNSNATNPYGLYVNGTITNPSSTTTANKADKATMQSTNSSFASWVASQPNSPLPVTLLFFKLDQAVEDGIVLKWATSSEINFDYFEIQRSTDGINFQTMDQVKGHGTTLIRQDYTWKDLTPTIGKNYYRLRSIDYDGYAEYFNLVAAVWEAERKSGIFPNPVRDGRVSVDLNFVPDSNTTITVSDLSGSVVGRFFAATNHTDLQLDLNPGTYIVTVQTSDFKTVTRLLVR